MTSVAELVLSIVGKDSTAGAFKSAGGNLKQFEKGAVAAGAAVTGLGVGIEAMARAQQEETVQVRENAAALGVTEGAYRSLATSISNAGFPLDDVNGLLTLAREEGLRGKDSLTDYANFWDLVGDATGESATSLAAAATGLRAVGVAAGDEGQALNAFGFIADNTKLSTEEFLGILEKKGAELKDFGISIDDTAAVLGVMERELGLTGRAAATEFATALDASDGSMESLLDTLGISKGSFDAMRGSVDASSGVLERNAAIVDKGITPMQKLEAAWKDFMFTHAGVIEGLAQFAPIMMAAGPAMGGLSAGIRGVGLAATFAKGPLLSMAATLLAPPLGIIIAIAAVAIALYVFRDDVVRVFKEIWEKVGPTVIAIRDNVVGAFNAVLKFGQENWPEIATLISGPFAPLVLLATDAFGVRSALTGAFDTVLKFGKENWPEIATLISGPFAPIVLLATDAFGIRSAITGALGDILGKVWEWGTNLKNFLTSLPGTFASAFGDGFGFLWDAFKDALNTIIKAWNGLSFSLPGFDPPGPGPKWGGVTINTPDIPLLARGGPVAAGRPYIVGDGGGPELFVPNTSGRVVPNGQFSPASGATVIFNGPLYVSPVREAKDPRSALSDVAFAIAAELRSRGRMLTA